MQGDAFLVGQGYASEDRMYPGGAESLDQFCVESFADTLSVKPLPHVDRGFDGPTVGRSRLPAARVGVARYLSLSLIDEPGQLFRDLGDSLFHVLDGHRLFLEGYRARGHVAVVDFADG